MRFLGFASLIFALVFGMGLADPEEASETCFERLLAPVQQESRRRLGTGPRPRLIMMGMAPFTRDLCDRLVRRNTVRTHLMFLVASEEIMASAATRILDAMRLR